MTALEPGPGMGLFTFELLRPSGKVVAVDIQPKRLERLKLRAAKAGLLNRLDAGSASPDSVALSDLAGTVDFTLPDAREFFRQIAAASKSRASLLLAEPRGHVESTKFESEVDAARENGFGLHSRPSVPPSHAAFLQPI